MYFKIPGNQKQNPHILSISEEGRIRRKRRTGLSACIFFSGPRPEKKDTASIPCAADARQQALLRHSLDGRAF
jgi:hypothetical protein